MMLIKSFVAGKLSVVIVVSAAVSTLISQTTRHSLLCEISQVYIYILLLLLLLSQLYLFIVDCAIVFCVLPTSAEQRRMRSDVDTQRGVARRSARSTSSCVGGRPLPYACSR